MPFRLRVVLVAAASTCTSPRTREPASRLIVLFAVSEAFFFTSMADEPFVASIVRTCPKTRSVNFAT